MPKIKTKKAPRSTSTKKEKKPLKIAKKAVKYFEGLGRRKTSTARVRLSPQKKEKSSSKRTSFSSSPSSPPLGEGTRFLINGKPLEVYFPTFELRETVLSPLKLMDSVEQFNVSVKVKGGGVNSQAEAVRNGIAKALVLFNPDFRKKLKKAGYLTRDARMRERKKFGLKRARRAPQWQKR